MEQQIAIVRSWGVALAAEIIPLAAVAAAEAYPVRKESLLGKRKAGRATNKTPVKAMRPASASLTVKGSRRATHAMKAVRVGTRNVMTVASDTSRYERESIQCQLVLLVTVGLRFLQ